MTPTITCINCGAVVPKNPRVKKQKYCSGKECQNAMRRSWKKKAYAKNRSYRRKHLNIQATWREQRPAYEYQKEIDRILDKISQSGYQNLTEKEKKILFEASKKMN